MIRRIQTIVVWRGFKTEGRLTQVRQGRGEKAVIGPDYGCRETAQWDTDLCFSSWEEVTSTREVTL